jgi:putative transposase
MFGNEDDFAFFTESLRAATRHYDCRIHAYAFLTNHVHLLLTPVDARAMGMAMRALGARYVRYFNLKYDRTGTLFEGRYRATVVDTDRYLFTCYRYIEENPLRAGLASELSAYRWSSYRGNALGAEDSLLTPHDQFVALGVTAEERQSAYRALFRSEIDSEAQTAIRLATISGVSLERVGSRSAIPGASHRGGVPASAQLSL